MRDKEIALFVRGKTFKISFVSNYVSVEFSKLSKQVKRTAEISGEIDALALERQAGDITNEASMERLDAYTVEVEEITKSLFPKRLELIQELLESNSIEFDRKFWERKTTPQDLNDFLYRCYLKDYDEEALKKSLLKTT